MQITIKLLNGSSFKVDYHLDKYLAIDFKNAQRGLDIDAKFFKTLSGAINYGIRQCTK